MADRSVPVIHGFDLVGGDQLSGDSVLRGYRAIGAAAAPEPGHTLTPAERQVVMDALAMPSDKFEDHWDLIVAEGLPTGEDGGYSITEDKTILAMAEALVAPLKAKIVALQEALLHARLMSNAPVEIDDDAPGEIDDADALAMVCSDIIVRQAAQITCLRHACAMAWGNR